MSGKNFPCDPQQARQHQNSAKARARAYIRKENFLQASKTKDLEDRKSAILTQHKNRLKSNREQQLVFLNRNRPPPSPSHQYEYQHQHQHQQQPTEEKKFSEASANYVVTEYESIQRLFSSLYNTNSNGDSSKNKKFDIDEPTTPALATASR
ncbi:hypothetical protein ScalyP_jg252 [Parmales sp. scaly parma]|nr:hypothetical protein ScalyP_jg252 [Parmales sp. scaly parma]